MAARMLFFILPVLLSKMMAGQSFALQEGVMVAFAVPALCFAIAGVVALLGKGIWLLAQYVVIGITFLCTVILFGAVSQSQGQFHVTYLLPALFAVGVLGYLLSIKKTLTS